MTPLDDECEVEPMLDVFTFDEHYEKNERKYKQIRKTILNETSDDKYESSENSSSSDNEDDQKKNDVNEEQTFDDEEKEKKEIIIDQTETNLVTLRETICLTIELSVDVKKCAHELLQMNVHPGLEIEVCQMILDTCAQKPEYECFFGLLSEHCCSLRKEYIKSFEKVFRDQYKIAHRLESFQLRNIAKFFGHLLCMDVISWKVFDCIRLTKKETTSLSRFFLKNLLFELFKCFGLIKLIRRLNEPTLTVYFEGLFPRDTKKNTDFAINFYTSIGLGGLAVISSPSPHTSSSSSTSSSSIHSNNLVSTGDQAPHSSSGNSG
ncbi:unnamed protein product [Rotaria sp. Silwood1]|nr:unnamed protein product [Rotaria sp. Silwood1]CAF4969613.1 unnamed protein product [Rotaria sp. Silwood1]CAF5013464.1 unnamed protein product [Rotaria sp. Silwood1]